MKLSVHIAKTSLADSVLKVTLLKPKKQILISPPYVPENTFDNIQLIFF